MEDGGGNSLVERKRGKLLRDAAIVDLITDEDKYVSDDEDSEKTIKNSYD